MMAGVNLIERNHENTKRMITWKLGCWDFHLYKRPIKEVLCYLEDEGRQTSNDFNRFSSNAIYFSN